MASNSLVKKGIANLSIKRKFCPHCNNFCNEAISKNIRCKICDDVYHKACVKKYAYNTKLSEMRNFICEKCTIDQLPFWILESEDIHNLYFRPKNNTFSDLSPIFLNNIFENNETTQDETDDENLIFCGNDQYFVSNELDQIEIGKNDHCFKSICLNIRSLKNSGHFSQLQLLLQHMPVKPTVIAINETYLKSNHGGPHCNLKGYEFISNCRNKAKGGGVGMYVKKGIDFDIMNNFTIMNEKIFESLFIEITTPGKKLVYGTIYRSPNNTSLGNMEFLGALGDM